MSRRHWVAGAITVVCALGMLASPEIGNRAYAAPRPPQPTGRPVAPPPVSLPPGAKPLPHGETVYQPSDPKDAINSVGADPSVDAVEKKLDQLYQQAGSATDAYDLATERADAQSADIARLTRQLADGQVRLDRLRQRAAAAPPAPALPSATHVLLSGAPRAFLDGTGRLGTDRNRQDVLSELTATQDSLRAEAEDAAANWKKLDTVRGSQKKAAQRITQRISDAKKLEGSLRADQRTRLEDAEKAQAQAQQEALLRSGTLPEDGVTASTQGAAALAFAQAQQGKPYRWGAAGPSSFDCSGLTSQAWAAAGRPIPRTSQEQWRLLPHVPLSQLRPGDLIIYYSDASHVALYAGDGLIVEAPRPGRTVTTAGAGSMPILGAVRPDA